MHPQRRELSEAKDSEWVQQLVPACSAAGRGGKRIFVQDSLLAQNLRHRPIQIGRWHLRGYDNPLDMLRRGLSGWRPCCIVAEASGLFHLATSVTARMRATNSSKTSRIAPSEFSVPVRQSDSGTPSSRLLE